MHANTQSEREGSVGHPKEGGGHQNYKVGLNKYAYDAAAEHLRCSVYVIQ